MMNLNNSNSRHRRDNSETGFTLLEIILTVALLALAMTIIYGVLDSTLQASERVDEALNDTEVGPAVLNLIRMDLEGAIMPYPDKVYFVGKNIEPGLRHEDQIDFVASTMALGKEDEKQEDERFVSINEVGYRVKPNKDNPDLYVLYRREDLFVDDDPLKGGKLIELYDRVKSLNITYYDGKEWVKEWDNVQNGKKLPDAVKIELTLMISSDVQTGSAEKLFETTLILKQ